MNIKKAKLEQWIAEMTWAELDKKFSRTTFALHIKDNHNNIGFCPLGVIVNLYVKNSNDEWRCYGTDDYGRLMYSFQGQPATLPRKVARWFFSDYSAKEYNKHNGVYVYDSHGGKQSLAIFNDYELNRYDGFTPVIAAIKRSYTKNGRLRRPYEVKKYIERHEK